MRTDNRKIGHSYLPVRHYAHSLYLVPVAGIPVPHILAVTAVYFLYYGVDAGQTPFDEVFVPAFERLTHYGVVCIGYRSVHYIPRGVPRIAVLVDKKAHKFRHRQSGMGIVYVDSDLIG